MKTNAIIFSLLLCVALGSGCANDTERREQVIRQMGQLEGRFDFENRTPESTDAFVVKFLSTIKKFPVPDSLVKEINDTVRRPIRVSEAQSQFIRECLRMATEPDTEKVKAFVYDNRRNLYRRFLISLATLTRKTAFNLPAPAALDSTSRALSWISRSLDALHGGDFFSASLAAQRGQTLADARRRAIMNACSNRAYRDMNSTRREQALASIAYGLRKGDLKREPRIYLNLLSNLQFLLYEKFERQEASVACGEFLMRHASKIGYRRLFAKALLFCGNALIDKGKFRQAEKQDLLAIPIMRRYGYEDEARLVNGRLNIIYKHLGRYQLALSYLKQSLPPASQPLDEATMMRYHIGRGNLFSRMGHYNDARMEYKKSVKFAERLKDGANESVALANIGEIYFDLADYDSALVYFRQAFDVKHDTPFLTSSALQELLKTYAELGQTDSTRKISERLEKLLSNSRSSTKMAQHSYGAAELQLKINEFEAAHTSLLRSLSYYAGMGDIQGQFKVLCKMAEVEMRQGRHATALETASKALRLTRNNTSIEMTWPAFYALAQIYAQSGDNARAEEALENATENIEKVATSVNTYQQRASFSDRIRPVYEQGVAVKLALGDTLAAFEYSEKERANALRNLLGKNREFPSRNVLLSSMNTGSDTLSTEQAVPTFQQISAALAEDACVLEYEVLDSNLVVWAIGRHGVETKVVPLPRHELAETVKAFRRQLDPRRLRGMDNIENSDREIRRLGHDLYTNLLRPLRTLARYKTLIIIPDEFLNDLPFAALVQYDGAFLVEKYCIAQEPSAAILVRMLSNYETRNPPAGRESIVCVVNPQLKYGRQEARSVARMCAQSDILLGSKIRKEALLKKLQGGPDALLFSTHGKIDARFPVNSHLAFKAETGAGAGKLALPEIQALDLHATELVYLSACESATGKLYRGEGTMSLQLSFITAGAKSVIANLWQIDDRNSMRLTTAFFHGWLKSGLSRLQAMRQAQLALIKSVRAKGLYPPHPYFWAPVTLTGFPG